MTIEEAVANGGLLQITARIQRLSGFALIDVIAALLRLEEPSHRLGAAGLYSRDVHHGLWANLNGRSPIIKILIFTDF